MTYPSRLIGDLLEDVRPGFACGDDVETGTIQIRMNNITRDGALDWSRVRRVPNTAMKSNAMIVLPGDVLFNCTNSPDLVGKTALFAGHAETVTFSNHFLRLRPAPNQLHGGYLSHWLRKQFQSGRFSTMCRQWVNQATVAKERLLSLRLPLPPLAEQRRIVAILDKAETLRAKRREAISKLALLMESLSAGLFADSFSGRHAIRLEQIVEFQTGYPFQSAKYVEPKEGVRLCRGANVLPGRIDWSELAAWPQQDCKAYEAFSLCEGDVVMAMDRPFISTGFKVARVTQTDLPCLLVQRVARLRAKGISTNVLYALLRHPAFVRHCKPTETTVPHISPLDIKSFAFSLPATDLQARFDAQMALLHRTEDAQVAMLRKADALFSSLQHLAFRGEL